VEVHTDFRWVNLKETDLLEDLGGDWRIILKWIFEKKSGSVDWIYVPQDRRKWRAVVNTAMNLLLP
jgi:hypothetical protein